MENHVGQETVPEELRKRETEKYRNICQINS